MNTLKPWPHLTIVAILFAALGGIAAGLWVRHEQSANAEVLQHAARLEHIDGQVGISNGLDDQSSNEWFAATPNTPISTGDRIYTRADSRASLAFTSRNFARINQGSSLDVLSLSDRRTQLALRDGSALFDLGYLQPGDLFEVATPYGAIDFYQPGLYEVGIYDNGSAWVSVLSGLAQVVGLAGSGQINKGEMLTLLGQTAAQIALSRLDPGYAGGLLDDYYSYRYPDLYDGRYRDYNAYLSDPYYYDPYNRYQSYQYVNNEIPGLYDLDYYGDWHDLSGYGHVWRPRVDDAWAPYQSGYWTNDYPYGLTWISNEPWGYAPYHYGRWTFVNNQWFWVPERSTSLLYSPALVAFIPQSNNIGWVPLAPGDPYAQRYYDESWQPHYLTRPQPITQQVVNLDVPGAITTVAWPDFHREIDRKVARKADRNRLRDLQLVLDPLSHGPLRNAALRSAWGRGKIDLPPGIAKRLGDRTVIASSSVVDLRDRKDLSKRLRVEAVPERTSRARMQFRDERRAERVSGQTRSINADRVETSAARGNRDSRRQVRELESLSRREQQGRPFRRARGERIIQPQSLYNQQRAAQEIQRQRIQIERQRVQANRRQALNQASAQRETQRVVRRSEERKSRGAAPHRSTPRVEYLRTPVRQREARRPNVTPRQQQEQRQIRQQQPQRSAEQRSQPLRRPQKVDRPVIKVERKQGRAGEAPRMRGGDPSGNRRSNDRRDKAKGRGR